MGITTENLLVVAETALMAPAGLLLGVGGGGVGLSKPKVKNPKAQAAKAIREIDKEIAQVSKKKKTLGEQIGERMKTATAELEELGEKPLPPPLVERKRQSTKGLTRPEIQARSQQNKELAKTASDEKKAARARAKTEKASSTTVAKAEERLDTLGQERPKKERNYLADEGARQFAKDVQSLDSLAQSYRKKYGVLLGEETLARIFEASAKKLRDSEELYHLPTVKGELQLAIENEVAKHRPFGAKVWDAGKEFVNLMRSIMASSDISYLGKQMGLAAAAHPVIAAKSAVPGLTTLAKGAKLFKNEDGKLRLNSMEEARDYVHKIEGEIVSNAAITYANRDFYTEVAGLDLNVPPPDLKTGWFSLLQGKELSPVGQEELASSFARRIPGVGRLITTSDLAFSAGRNWAATKIFDKLYNHDTMTPQDAAYIGKFVNMITGRTNWKDGALGSLVRGLSPVLFSPRFAASRFEFAGEAVGSMGGLNPWRAPMGATGLSAKTLRVEMAKIALGYGAFYSAMASAQLAGLPFEVGTDPRSVTFGTVKLPSGAYLDPLASMKQLAVTAYRAGSGEQINLAGKGRDVTSFDMWSRYLRSKLNPGWAALTSASPTFSPEEWRDYNGKLLAPEHKKHASQIANALGVVPTERGVKATAYFDAVLETAKKSFTPLGVTSLIEDVEFYSRKEGLSPEEYGFVVGHVLSNFLGYTVMNYDANRAQNPNRKRGGSGLSLPKLPRLDTGLPRL